MGMPDVARIWTRAEVLALPDDGHRDEDRGSWVINPDARLVDLWTPRDERPATIVDQLVWHPEASAPPLTIDLPSYFRSVWAE